MSCKIVLFLSLCFAPKFNYPCVIHWHWFAYFGPILIEYFTIDLIILKQVLIQPDTVYERVQYQFEDDAYDTVPDLITYYVGSGKSISAASGARIRFPCNRTYPLSFYAAKYGINQAIANSRGVSPLNSPSLANVGFRYVHRKFCHGWFLFLFFTIIKIH